jgi:hypothetical protein
VERPEYYRTTENPDGLDPARWRASGAQASVAILVQTQGETDYRFTSRAFLAVAEDRAAAAGAAGKYTFYRLEAIDASAWIAVLNLHGMDCAACPPTPPDPSAARPRDL